MISLVGNKNMCFASSCRSAHLLIALLCFSSLFVELSATVAGPYLAGAELNSIALLAPPPVENVPGSAVAQFDRTPTASGTDQEDLVKAERANYYDGGISEKITPHLQVGVDGYYKETCSNENGRVGRFCRGAPRSRVPSRRR